MLHRIDLNELEGVNTGRISPYHPVRPKLIPAYSFGSSFKSDDTTVGFDPCFRAKSKLKGRLRTKNTERRQEEAVKYQDATSQPVRGFLYICYQSWLVQKNKYWNMYILFCIIIAGLLVGVQTYPAMQDNIAVLVIDHVVLYSFAAEIILKILSEGLSPWWFLLDEKNRYWNIFDFVVVLGCMPFIPAWGPEIIILRFFRLARLGKLFRRVPQLRMIFSGLFVGLKSIFYIVIVEILICYLYAVAGILFFRNGNSMYNFRSVEVSFFTLLSILTYDNWGDILYTSYYGCDNYGVLVLGYYTNDPSKDQGRLGGLLYCSNPDHSTANKVLTIFWFFSFVFLAGWCILSMFVGTVINAMVDSVADMIIEDKKYAREMRKKAIDREVERLTDTEVLRNSDRTTKRTVRLIKLVFSGRTLIPDRIKVSGMMNRPLTSGILKKIHDKYVTLVDVCAELVESSYFQNFITSIIVLVCAQVGFQTNPKYDVEGSVVVGFIDNFVLSVFVFEAGLKIIAEGSTPWAYFYNNWNKFDFAIVFLTLLPTGNRNLVLMLRLLRLMRILKLLRAFPKLQVIVTAILNSLISIFYIGVIITLFFYVYAVVGMMLFSSNDPIHYGNLHLAMLTLFQIMTFDNWTPIELTNAYGCFAPVSAYTQWFQGHCDTRKNGNFVAAFIYYYSFAVIAGMILISLFIGVVNVYMDITNEELSFARVVQSKVKKIAEDHNMDHYTVGLYYEVFCMLDFAKAGYIGKTELRFGVDVSGSKVSDEEFKEIEQMVDQNHDNKVDFSEFLKFAIDLKYQRNPHKLRKSNRKKLFYKSYHMMNTCTISYPEPSKLTEEEKLEVVQDIQSAYQNGDLEEHEYQVLNHKYKSSKDDKMTIPLSIDQADVSQHPNIFTWWFPEVTSSAAVHRGLERAASDTEAGGGQSYTSGLPEISHLFSFLTPSKQPVGHITDDTKEAELNDLSESKSVKSLNSAYMADLPGGANKAVSIRPLSKNEDSSTDILGYWFPDIFKLAVCPPVKEENPNDFALKERTDKSEGIYSRQHRFTPAQTQDMKAYLETMLKDTSNVHAGSVM